MREVKFRAWNKAIKKTEKVLSLEWDAEGILTKVKTESGTYNADEVHLMQCIGEMNRQEVYEGDILYDPWSEDSAIVDYDEESYSYCFHWIGQRVEESIEANSDMIVEGTIYDSPEEMEVLNG